VIIRVPLGGGDVVKRVPLGGELRFTGLLLGDVFLRGDGLVTTITGADGNLFPLGNALHTSLVTCNIKYACARVATLGFCKRFLRVFIVERFIA